MNSSCNLIFMEIKVVFIRVVSTQAILMISISAQSNYTSICLLTMQIYFLSIKRLIYQKVILTNELSEVHSWLCANKLSLNINKSNFVLFHPIQRKIPKSVTLFINNQSLTEEHSITYLGIYIDSNLNWKSHINYIAKKVKRSVGTLSKVR